VLSPLFNLFRVKFRVTPSIKSPTKSDKRRKKITYTLGLVCALFFQTIGFQPAQAVAAPTAWTVTANVANYSQGGITPIFTGSTTPAGAATLTCKAYTAADTLFATPLTLTASTTIGATYKVRCTGVAASGYAASPTSNTTAALSVVANLSLTCNANFYQVSNNLLYKLTYTSGASPPFSYAAFGAANTINNAIGWNPDDNYIYGLNGGNLYRLASDQSVTNLGATITAAGAATTANSTGGDFYRINGTAYLMSASGTTFNLTNPASRVVSTMTVTSGSWAPYDMTIIGNTAWGFDGTTLYKGVITSNGTIAGTSIAITSKAGVTGTVRGTTTSGDRYGAMYSDSDQNLYMFSNTGNDLFQITAARAAAAFAPTPVTPAATFIVHATKTGGAAVGSPNDGAGCPNASSPTAPTLTTTAGATSITVSGGSVAGSITTATLTGSNIASGSLLFCYAITELLLASSPTCVNSSPDTMAASQTSAAISANLTGLDHGTLYYFRSKATNTLGAAGYGTTQSFTTLADWTLNADSKGYTIGGAVPTLTAVAAPLAGISGATTCRAYAPADVTYVSSKTIDATLAAGDYVIHCTAGGAAGYSATPTTNVNATLRVTALLSWTITAADASYTLNGSIPTLSGAASPLAGLSGALTCRAYTVADTGFVTAKTIDINLAAGTYVIHCTGSTASGYAAPSVIDKTLTVTRAPWTITAVNKDYTIDGTVPTLTGTVSPVGAINGSLTCAIYLDSDLGYTTPLTINNGLGAHPYPIHCTGTPASGYSLTPTIINASLNVTALTSWAITANAASYTYGQTPASLSGAASPAGGLSGALTCSAYAVSDTSYVTALVLSTSTAVGTYTIHCAGSAANGYTSTPTYNDAVLTVNPIAWSISATAASYSIGGSVPSLTGTASPADGLNGSLTCFAYTSTDLTYLGPVTLDTALAAGTYVIHCSGTPATGYSPTPTVNDAALTVSISTFTITYNGNTHTGGSAPVDSSSPYNFNSTATVKANTGSLVKTGYSFNGWNTSADGTGTPYAATGSVTFTVSSSNVVLYAQWLIASFTATFDLSGGNISGSVTNPTASVVYQVDALGSKPANPTRTGYSFGGWNLTGSGSALSSYAMPGANTSFVALWTVQSFTATFNMNGGAISGSRANTTASIAFGSDALTGKPANPTMSGYTFVGWNLTGSGSALSSYTMPASAATLIAIWQADAHTVTYAVGAHGSGVVPTQASVATLGTFTVAASALVGDAGYTFNGWNDGSHTYIAGETYTVDVSNVVMTAMWQASSLDGIDLTKIVFLGTLVASNSLAGTISVNTPGTPSSGVALTLPAGALPAGTQLDIYDQTDLTKARLLISSAANAFSVSLVVAWLAPDGSIPHTAVGKPISITITNSDIFAGDVVYGMIGINVRELGTATTNGSVTFTIFEDPEIIITRAPPSIAITTGATQSVQVGTAILTTAVTNSGGSITGYSISPSLPSALSLNTSTGAISGTPAAVQSVNSYTLTATGAGGTSTATFTLTVTAAPPSISITTGATQSVQTNAAIVSTIVTNSGGPITSYGIAPALPTGLTLNTSSGVISGTPTGAQSTNSYTLTATGPAGGTSSATFTLTVVAPPNISITTGATQSVQVNNLITSTINANSGGAISSYSVTTLPTGLSLDATTGVISGTPTSTQTVQTYTLTATGPLGGTSTATFTLTVTAAPPNISITTGATQSVQVNTAITNTVITNTGGPVTSYSVTTLPTGLSFDATTGVLSGTPTGTQTQTSYTVTATGPNGGISTATFRLTVTAAPPIISITTGATQTVLIGVAITATVVTNTGGPITSFAISPSLSGGLTFNSGSGAITGTPTGAQTSTPYAVTATGPNGGTSTATFTLTVVDLPNIAITTGAIQSVLVGSAITTTVVTNTGGPISSFAISPSLPTGLTLDTGTGAISGTPTGPQSTNFYTLTATGPNGGTSTDTFTFTANAVGAKVVTFNANDASGRSSTQSSLVAANLTANSFTRSDFVFVNWTTNSDGTGTTFTDLQSYSFSADLTLFARWADAAPNISIAIGATQVVIVNQVIVSTSVENTGGAITSFEISPTLPSGLTLNTTDGTISGTPTTIQSEHSYSLIAQGPGGISSAVFTLTVTVVPDRTVTFNANDLSGRTTSQISSVSAQLTPNSFTRSGYTFVNWNTSADGTGSTFANLGTYSFGADLTLFARWEVSAPTVYTLTYVAGAHGSITGTSVQSISSGGSGSAVTAVAATDYSFSVWSDGSTSNPRIDSSVVSTRTITASFIFVGPQAQSITFTNPGTQQWSPFVLNVTPTASSTLAVTLVSSTSSVCSVSGYAITFITTGSCSLTASQDGGFVSTAHFAAAPSVIQTFTVAKASGRTIEINASSYSSTGYATWNLTGPTLTSLASAGDSDTKTYFAAPSSEGCSVATSGKVVFSGAGVCRVKVSISGTLFDDATSPAIAFEIGKNTREMALTPQTLTYKETLQLKAPDLDGTGTVKFSLASSTNCRLSGDKLTAWSGVGTCDITVTKSADTNYEATTSSVTITLTKAGQKITLENAQLVFGKKLKLKATSGSGSGSITYSVDDSTACSIALDEITALSGTGICIVTASKAEDSNYLGATTTANITLTKEVQPVTKKPQVSIKNSQTLALANSGLTYGRTVTLEASQGSGTGAITYSVDNPDSCSITANKITALSGTGSCVVTVNKEADANYESAIATATITLNKAAQTVTLSSTELLFGKTLTLDATTGDGSGDIEYSVDNAMACELKADEVTARTGSGRCVITLTKAADANYAAAKATAIISLKKAAQSVAIGNAELMFGKTLTLDATTGDGSGAVKYSTTSKSSCSVKDAEVTALTGTGSCEITLTKAADSNYEAASATGTILLTKQSQTLSVTGGQLTYGSVIKLKPTSGKGVGTISYTTENTDACSIKSNEVTALTGTGSCVITVSKAADSNYEAVSITAIITLNKQSQTLSVTGGKLTFGGTLTLKPTSGNGSGSISYVSENPNACSINADEVTALTGTGSCVITVTKASDKNYKEISASATISLSKVAQSITLSNAVLMYGSTITLDASAGKGSGALKYSLNTKSSNNCSIKSNEVKALTGTGTCLITVTKVADSNYDAATSKSTITLTKAPETITLSDAELMFGKTMTLDAASGSSTGDIKYSVNPESNCSVKGNKVKALSGTGNCVISVSKAEDANFGSATTTATITLLKKEQALALASDNLTFGKKVQIKPVTNVGTGAITYTADDPKACQIKGDQVIALAGAGQCVITANKAEDENYAATTTTVLYSLSCVIPKAITLGGQKIASGIAVKTTPNKDLDAATSLTPFVNGVKSKCSNVLTIKIQKISK